MTDESSHFSGKKTQNIKKMNVTENAEMKNQVCNDMLLSNYASSHLTIQGSFHQGADIFGTNSGKQCVANCLLAVVKSKLRHVEQWDQAYLDSVLMEGNELYSYIHGDNNELLVSELPEMVEVSEMLVRCQRKESYGAIINASNSIDFSMIPNALPLDQALQESLIDTDGCFICVQGFTSIAIRHNMKLFLFDSHARNAYGFPDVNGNSIILELQDVHHLYELLCNFVRYNDGAQFEITGIVVNIIDSCRLGFSIPQLEKSREITDSSHSIRAHSIPDIEITSMSSTNCSDDNNDVSSDVEIISDTSSITYKFCFITTPQRRKLCTVLGIPSKYVCKSGNYAEVLQMGLPNNTKSITGDGNCLFRAISYAVSQRQEFHMKVRSAIVKHSLQYSHQLVSFLDSRTVSDYISSTQMTEENVWGTAFEILVAADLLKTDIYTYSEGKWLKYSSKMICIDNDVNEHAIYLKHVDNHYEVVTGVSSLYMSSSCTENVSNVQKRKKEPSKRHELGNLKKLKQKTTSNKIVGRAINQKRRCPDSVDTEEQIDNNDTVFATDRTKKNTKNMKEKEKYHNDPEFKAKKRAKYHDDEQYRVQILDKNKIKYWENETYNQLKKDADRKRYADIEEYKQSKKEASKQNYATDEAHREIKKTLSKTKYSFNQEHQQKVKDQVKQKREKNQKEQTQIHKVVEKFKKEAKKGPEYVCACCFRLFFNSQVKVCRKDDYTDKNEQVKYASIVSISEKYLHKCNRECETACKYSESSRIDLWICFTCHRKILKGNIPAECHANNLELEEVPKELNALNTLEQHLVALNIPFMKVMGLPNGGQKGVHGPVVCVPSDLNQVTCTLPRCDDDNQMLRVKLKRKLCYKGYEEYQFVCPKRLEEAFLLLKKKNTWFSDINFSNKWLNPIPEEVEMNENQVKNEDQQSESELDGESEGHCQIEHEHESYLDDGLRGLQFDTSLQPDDIGQEVLDRCFDQVFNVSPAEGNSPVSILKEEGIEAKSFPVHYPSGKNTFTDERNEKLSLLRYFNLRLTSVENRFARDISYIFFSQYITELDRIISNVQISLRKESAYTADGKSITSASLCNKDSLKHLFKKDEAIKYLKPVRGTPPYWQSTQKDIFAMIRQLGIPTFFCSFSSADFRWPEMIETIMRQQGDTRSSEDLDWNEKCKILRSNPVTMARMFEHRFHTFLYDVILSNAQPIGKVIDYFYRVEFQQRGSPHTHCLFWIEDAPKLDVDDDDEVVQFIDKYVTCEIPDEEDDPELYEIVKTVHQHSKNHSKSCRKKGTVCRFNFPRPPSTRTFISRANDSNVSEVSDEPNDAEEGKAKEKLAEIWQCIMDKENEGMSTEDLLNKVDITQTQFEKLYNSLSKKHTVVLKRNVNEIYTNQYNKHLLRAWNANMDIQPVLDAYSCIVYMISYISKAERELGILLQQTKVEAQEGNLDAQRTMKKIGTAYMHHREISAQEAVFRVTGLKLKECSRHVQFIPIGENPCRMSLPLKLLAKNKDHKTKDKSITGNDEDENSIWMKSIVDRYKERPMIESFEIMCLAKFCSEYSVLSESQIPQKINKETTFQLGNGMGYIRKRTRTEPAVIRYPRFSVEAEPEKFYQSILQLFLPYRQDRQLKPAQFETYECFYKTGNVKLVDSSNLVSIQSLVDENKALFVKDENIIDKAEKQFEERGIQEDAWGCLFPETEVDRHECLDEGTVSTVIEQENTSKNVPDLNQSDKSKSSNLLSMRIQTNEILPLLRALNTKQRQIFYKIREWCLRKESGEVVEPFHIFITGGGGTGKSHLIKCLYYEATRILARNIDNPDDITVLLTAPTGTAAFNINGMTIHSALSIFKTLSADHALLSEDRINTLRSKLENLHILIIDEISMVNKRLLFFIHERLRQIKKTSENCLFGGVSVIAVGDFYQLPPVKTKRCDKLYINDLSNPVDHLWSGLFKLVELDEIMRQREDSSFAEILNRLRVKQKHESIENTDLEALQNCMTEGPDDALHIFATNEEVRNYNSSMIMKIPSEPKLIEAEDYLKVKTTGRLIKKKINFSQSEILLPTSLLLAEGARVMLIKNIDISDGLVNGVMGTIVAINQSLPNQMPDIIYIQFDNIKVGKNAETKKSINGQNCVGLKPCTEDVPKQSGSRKQFPLQLAWACTVHKVQGLTVNECVVALNKCFSYGQAYVALSRVTSMRGLHITNIDEKQLNNKVYCDPDVTNGLLTMEKFIPDLTKRNVDTHTVTIMYHNIQGLKNHITDLQANPDFKDVDCICLVETWLTEQNIIQLEGYQSVQMPRCKAYDAHDDIYKGLKQMQNGGVGVYFKNNGKFKETSVSFSNLECVVLEVCSMNVFIVTLYRTKQYQIQKFQENLALLLESLFLLSHKIIIVGDFNQNILKEEVSLKNFMNSQGFMQLVQMPTTEGRTLIDHVYVQGCSNVTVSVIPTYYSYHDAISIELNLV